MALTEAEVIRAWETGLAQRPADRTLTLLALVLRDVERSDLEKTTLGECNQQLLRLHEELFGCRLECLVDCPNCADRLELSLNSAGLREIRSDGNREKEVWMRQGHYRVQFRVPTCGDLIAIADSASPEEGGTRLLERCVKKLEHDGKNKMVHEIPRNIVSAIAAEMEKRDPSADLQVELVCPACHNKWFAPFEIASFVWSKVCHWAKRLLNEVHLLASTYGWAEDHILSLSSVRRQYYISRILT